MPNGPQSSLASGTSSLLLEEFYTTPPTSGARLDSVPIPVNVARNQPKIFTLVLFHHLRRTARCDNCYDYVTTMFQPGGKRMPITTRDVRQTLLETDVEFRSLVEEHSRCETQLKQLLTEPYLSSEDLALETTLKKTKLRLKDQMEMIIARSRQQIALPT
jgi:uncharacterized protein YdcH (DUF465 family)